MREAILSALKLMVVVFVVALSIAFIDLRWLEPMRTPPCDPAKVAKGHICLSTLLQEWDNKIIWIDARKQDDVERHPFTHENSYPIRPNDTNALDLMNQAMPAIMGAQDEGQCIVVFCNRDCTSSDAVANELKKPEYEIEAPIFILEGGWDELKKDKSLVP